MKELVGMLINEYKSFDIRESEKESSSVSIKVSDDFWDKFNKIKNYCRAMERHLRKKFDKKNLRNA